LNTTSHDEENYEDPWQALVRYAVASTQDGIPMIFPGQELGIRKTWGYDHYERNLGKTIPHFKRYNSMMPAWHAWDSSDRRLFSVYAAINRARAENAALRSTNRWFLETGNEKIFGVAKWEAGSRPVLAFVNLDPHAPQKATVKLPPELLPKLGFRKDGLYQARNIAAESDSTRQLWGSGLTGEQLLEEGFPVEFGADSPLPAGPLYLQVEESGE
jgi:hypothetical protein